jgi:hypothetical protein
VTKSEFLSKAGNLELLVGDSVILGRPREFNSGSVGWNISAKVAVTIPGGGKLTVQVCGNVVAVDSRDWLTGAANANGAEISLEDLPAK